MNDKLERDLRRAINVGGLLGNDAELLNRCYDALFAAHDVASVPDGLPLVIAGALFDFGGYLTTREKGIEVGATANASPMVELIKEFADMRGLSLTDAAVLSWSELLPLAAAPQPVAQQKGGMPDRTQAQPADALIEGLETIALESTDEQARCCAHHYLAAYRAAVGSKGDE